MLILKRVSYTQGIEWENEQSHRSHLIANFSSASHFVFCAPLYLQTLCMLLKATWFLKDLYRFLESDRSLFTTVFAA